MITTREFLERLDWPACFYCQRARATHREHVVAKAMRRRHHIRDDDERYHVASCGPCNWTKSTLRLFPRGFDTSLLPGTGWREWDGSVEALRKEVRA